MLESRQENGLVPDIIAVSSSRKLAIEIFVTHKCDEAKAVVLTSCCDAAMEIDASGVNRQIEKEALRDLVISRLPRSWIFNSRVDEACESMRRLHNDREREASEAKEREISAKADRAIRRYIREENSQGYSLDLTMLQFSGLASLAPYIGVDVDGLSGFASDAASWQYHVVGNILLDADDEYLTSDDIYYCLCRDGYVKEWIRKLDGAVIDRMARRYPFTRPSESVTIYLDSLTRAGIVEFKDSLEHPRNRWKQSEAGWRSYRIKPSFVADAIAAAEEKLTAVKHRCAMIDFILSEIRELTGHGFEEICWTDRVDDMTGVKILEIGQSTKFWDDVLDAYERLSHGEALSRADRERIIGRFIELPRDGVSYQHASPEI